MSNDSTRIMPFSRPEDLNDYIVIDVETTGTDAKFCKIIQLSAVRFINHRETASFNTYINPGCPIPAEVSELTGITSANVVGAPSFEEKLEEFRAFVSASPYIAGWNVSFDVECLLAAGSSLEAVLSQCFDVMLLYGRAVGKPYTKLAQACEDIGYSTDFHNALNDCRACGAVLAWLCQDNRMDHALHSKGERASALKEYLKKSTSGVCPINPATVQRGGALEGKCVVFTGALSFSRADAAALAKAAGATIKTDVSKKVQYLIVGEQDEILVGCDGLSSKEEKAAVLNQKGAAIATISEQDFLKMLL